MIYNEIGTTSLYTFTKPFEELNGIYTLTKTLTFDQAIAESIDFVNGLYVPAGRGEAEFQDEWRSFRDDQIFQLKSVNENGNLFPVPKSILDRLPDANVREFDNLYIAITLGFFDDPEQLSWLIRQLQDMATSVTGETDTVHIYSTGTEWMTDKDYQDLKTVREAKVEQVQPLIVTVREQQNEILRLRNIINQYETTLLTLRQGETT